MIKTVKILNKKSKHPIMFYLRKNRVSLMKKSFFLVFKKMFRFCKRSFLLNEEKLIGGKGKLGLFIIVQSCAQLWKQKEIVSNIFF